MCKQPRRRHRPLPPPPPPQDPPPRANEVDGVGGAQRAAWLREMRSYGRRDGRSGRGDWEWDWERWDSGIRVAYCCWLG